MRGQDKELLSSVLTAEALSKDNDSDKKDVPDSSSPLFRRGYSDFTSLVANHYIWQSHLHYLLHPTIPQTPPSAPSQAPLFTSPQPWRIADIASGACAWSLDLAQQYPSSKITCLDTSSKQAPHPACLPKNVNWRQWDISTPASKDLLAAFDIVHLRLGMTLMTDEHAGIVRNVASLLRPGGFLQWEECDLNSISTSMSPPPAPPTPYPARTPNLEELYDRMIQTSHPEWTESLCERVVQGGFEDVKEYNVEPRAEYGKMMSFASLTGWEDRFRQVRDDEERTKWLRVLEKAEREIDEEEGALTYAIKVVVGRKTAEIG